MGLAGRGLINIITAGTGGSGGSAGVTSIEGLSGIVDLDSPDGSININSAGQVIELTIPNSGFAPSGASFLLRQYDDNGHLPQARILSATSGITLDDFGVRSGSGLVIKLDFDNEPTAGQSLTWNGTKLQWSTITGGGGVDTQTSINGLSGVVSLVSANSGAIDIIQNGQTLTLSGLFTPASGSIIDQKCADILNLSGITNGLPRTQTTINSLSGTVLISSPTQALEISTSGQTILLSGIFTPASGAVLQQKCADVLSLSGTIAALPGAQTSIEGLSGLVDLDSPDGSIEIGTLAQTIQLELNSRFYPVDTRPASGHILPDAYCLHDLGQRISSRWANIHGCSGHVDRMLIGVENFTDPDVTLEASGEIRVTDDSPGGQARMRVRSSNNGSFSCYYLSFVNGDRLALCATPEGQIQFLQKDPTADFIQAMTIQSGLQFVGVGPEAANPRCRLDVSGLICASGLQIISDRPTVSGIGVALVTELNVGTTQKASRTFTPSSGLEFVLQHGLNSEDWVATMWRTDSTPQELLIPDNIYPSGVDHAIVTFESSDSAPSGYTGRVVFVG